MVHIKLLQYNLKVAVPPLLSPQRFLFHCRYDFCVYVHVEIKLEAEALLTGVLRRGGRHSVSLHRWGSCCMCARSRSTGGLLLTTLPGSDKEQLCYIIVEESNGGCFHSASACVIHHLWKTKHASTNNNR